MTAEIDILLDTAVSAESKVKFILEQLYSTIRPRKEEDNTAQTILDTSAPSPEERIRSNLYGSVFKQFETSIFRLQGVQNELKNIMQARVLRDAEIILNRKLAVDEKQDILDNPEQVQKFYENKLTGAAHIQLQNAVSDIEERHKEIMKLERVPYLKLFV